MNFTRASTIALGAGSLAFGIWGLVHPRSLTETMGDVPEAGPILGIRDTLVGVALLNSGGAASLVARTASDLSDAVRLRKRSPKVALGALAIAMWGAATTIARRNARLR